MSISQQGCGKKIPYVIGNRRPGDIACCYADCEKAKALLGFEARYDIGKMCEDSWRWQKNNPDGYRGSYGQKQIE